jgi:hypothetical protein
MSDAPDDAGGRGDDWLRLTVDPRRLAVLGQLAGGPRTVGELTAGTALPEREVLGVLGTLVSTPFVEADGARYRLRADRLRGLAAGLRPQADVDRSVLSGMTSDEQIVLRRFFDGTRLTHIPPARAKRHIVLERLALDFEPGVVYPEATVNEILAARHPDYASLRRHLVDEGFLDRDHGRYWRAGGRVDVGGQEAQ